MPPTIRTIAAIVLIAGLGVLDGIVSSRLPFSILYLAAVAGAAWYGNRTHGLVVAVAALAARVGNQLLRAISTSLSLTTRMGDLAARLENDEFALLLYGCAPDNALKIGQRLVDEVAELGRAYPNARVTASVGMACFAASGPDPDEMMRLAGAALRRARHEGGNVVIIETADKMPREVTASAEPPA